MCRYLMTLSTEESEAAAGSTDSPEDLLEAVTLAKPQPNVDLTGHVDELGGTAEEFSGAGEDSGESGLSPAGTIPVLFILIS